MGGAAPSTIDSGGRELGPSFGGAAAALVDGGATASTVENGGATGAQAARRVTGGFRGRELEALAGKGGIGSERVNPVPGSVAFRDRGNYGERVRECPFDSTRIVDTGVAVARGNTSSPLARVCEARI